MTHHQPAVVGHCGRWCAGVSGGWSLEGDPAAV